MAPILKLSVHQLVDFLLRTGDIDNRIYNKASMSEGSRIHAIYQKKQSAYYQSEVSLKRTFFIDDFEVVLEGRADGIIVLPSRVIIDEIKSTVIDLDEFKESQTAWHLGQAECYALMYALDNGLDEIDVRLTYISQIDRGQKIFEYRYKTTQLENNIRNLIHQYLSFYEIVYRNKINRNLSCEKLEFPFNKFRQGQRKLAKYCYGIALKGGRLFVEAPTGIGKTMSTLFPFVKSFKEGHNEKIFYLTAKTSGRESAFNACLLLKGKGFKGSMIEITAKEKICFQQGAACNPDECPFAKDYYLKIQNILRESILIYDYFSFERIIDIAAKNEVCPFELELDLSLYSDIIICDYNYLFDPMVYMKRYFDEDASSYIALIDEAHNLVERGRDMYSSLISYQNYKEMKKSLSKFNEKDYKNIIKRFNKLWKEIKDLYEEEILVIDDINPRYLRIFEQFITVGQGILKKHPDVVEEAFLSFFFDVNRFLKLYELYDESFSLIVEKNLKNDINIKFLCLDPSRQLNKTTSDLHASVFFSATLSPSKYYVDVLGGNEIDSLLVLPSPFPKENLLLMVQPNISTKYKDRDRTYGNVASSIRAFIENKIGNYFVFFSSYAYLNAVLKYFKNEDINLIVQSKDMKEVDKINFLNQFKANPKVTTVGFVVLGGAFGEGIDLIDDRLIGAIVVGVGLPTISFERNLIKKYYDEKEGNGYIFSYVNPGMNRVMQAVGRVIRSETDKGMILLIDDRFLHHTYQDLFKNEWKHYKVVYSEEEIRGASLRFWKK